jgi:hypothetical protein
MTPDQTAKVLAKIQLGDNRVVDALTLREWLDTIGYLDFDDAIQAVTLHRRESTEYLQPAHVIRNAKRIREDRPQPNLEWHGDSAPKPKNLDAMTAAYRSGDPHRIQVELGVYNRQVVDAGRRPVPDWPLPDE